MDILDQISEDLFDTLRAIFRDNKYATRAIMVTLKDRRMWKDDRRALFSDTIYEIVRYWRLLWYILGRKPSLFEKDIRELIDIYVIYKEGKISNSDKIAQVKLHDIIKRMADAQKVRVLRESIPDWLDEVGSHEVGKRWDMIIKVLNQKPELIIRVNIIKTTQDDLIQILINEGIGAEKINLTSDALLLKQRTNVFRLQSFRDGLFEVQDSASQMVSHFLAPQPGMRVVDACAGEGSKTIHLAAVMKNRGTILALDTQEWRLQELRRRARRAGVDNIEVRHISSSRVYKRLKGTADRLLLDVPCSGLGTLRRNPDIKWKLIPADLERLRNLQSELLERYCTILKTGGQMVYATCSILPSEGEDRVNIFLKNHNNEFKLIKEKRYSPDTDRTDGFYIALIERHI